MCRKNLDYSLMPLGQNKLRREIRRHKFCLTVAQVSPLSRHLLLTRINIPSELITEGIHTHGRTHKHAYRERHVLVIVPSYNTSGKHNCDAEMKIIIVRHPIMWR